MSKLLVAKDDGSVIDSGKFKNQRVFRGEAKVPRWWQSR